MAETDPNKTGTQTTEFKLTSIMGVLGSVIVGLSVLLDSLHLNFPNVGWIGMLSGALTAALPTVAYILGRSGVKIAQLKVEAAEALGVATSTQALTTSAANTNPVPKP